MSPLDRLRRHADIPDGYSWAAIALSVTEAREAVERWDRLGVAYDELARKLDAALARVAELEAAARRCADCGRAARELIATQDGDGGVVYLGPGCSRKRMQAAERRAQPLPIGGAR